MSTKPLINGKGVNKPFCSPFRNITTSEGSNCKNNSNTPELQSCNSPLRVSLSKRLHFQQSPSPKKIRLSNENSDEQANGTQEKDIGQDKILRQSDIYALKKKIQEKRQSIKEIKVSLAYRRKNKAEDLEASIEKWTGACQEALTDYQNDVQERFGRPMSMTEILSSFGIDCSLVRYSNDDETFY